jgi:hypothetical protein
LSAAISGIGLGVAVALCLAGCGGSRTPPVTTVQGPALSVSSPGEPENTAAPESETGLPERAAQALDQVARVRGLVPRAAVKSKVLSRADLLTRVRKHVDDQIPHEAIRNQGEILVAFGLVAPSYDYEAGSMSLLGAQLAGYFEPSDKVMYLAADLSERVVVPTLVHEMVHALQDQHFDLGRKLEYRPHANDLASAIQSLAEGDATSAMMDVMLADVGKRATDVSDEDLASGIEAAMALDSSAADVPRVMRASLVAPYVDGLRFVHALRRRGGWKAVDDVWRSPPETTEQLLHLDKLDAREKAEDVDVPAAPDPQGWKVVYDDVLGEQGFRIALEDWVPHKTAAVASAGWAGDRAALYQRASRFAAAWRVRFDRAKGGDESAWARRAFRAIAEATGAGVSNKLICTERGPVGPLAVAYKGRDLVIVAGPYSREGAHVGSDAKCAQTARWVADILAGRSR